MTKTIRYTFTLILGVFMASALFAQLPSNENVKSARVPGGVIYGKVKEKGDKTPMQYSSIVLYRLPDSTMVNGTITGKDGAFKFKGVKNGHYFLKVHFIGFKIKVINNIEVANTQRQIKLPVIYLEPAASTLQGVEVKADRYRISYQVDKQVVNVTKDLMASAGSAVDVLENVPSVNVDLNGNVTLRGSSNFTVLINGHPSVLKGNDALQQIPAATIQRIEIITNPSAKYDPEGVGGILNIILKKDKNLGVNGVVNASAGNRKRYRGNALLGYRTKKINVFVSANGSYRNMYMSMNSQNLTYAGDTTNYRITNIDGVRNRKGFGLTGGLDYYPDKKSTLTLSGKYGGYGFGMDNTSKRTIYTVPATTVDYSKSISHSNRWGYYYTAQADFLHKFNNSGHQIEAYAYYSGRSSDNNENQSNYTTGSLWNDLGNAPSGLRTSTPDSSNNLRLKLDYSLPIGKKGKFEAGYQSRFYNESGKYTYETFDTLSNEWISNENYNNVVDFKRNIHSAYVSFQDVYKSFGYELGFRTEYTDRSVDNNNGKAPFIIKRFDYFPTVHLSYQLPENYLVYSSYSRRINRPRQWSLNPFPIIIDPYNIRVGNPELEPEYIDSYELGLQKFFSKSFLSFEAYYRKTTNKITRIRVLDTTGIMIHTSQNLNKDFAMGAELMANLKFVKWFGFNASLNLYHYRLEGNVQGSDLAANSTNWSGRMTASFYLKHNFRIQLMGIYRSPTVTVQGTRKGFFYTNLAVREDFFKRKLNLTLSARDLLGTARYESTASGTGFYSHSVFRREWPVVSLNLTYIINNYKQKKATKNMNDQGTPPVGF
ncbi:MAG: TonB-dependent receptor [bacterium]|nr:MAG: TonB-dependent receptor [bacterium]